MGITINSSAITVDNYNVSFEDIYQYAVSNNKTQYISKLGSSYEIKNNLILINNTTLTDINVFVTVLGDLIQIDKTSTLYLGEIRTNGSTLNGCTLNAPNIKLAYGFGNTTTSDSGNLFLYGSTVNIFGFWSFFSGNNHVEIIDCFIDGFGRIEGSNSILKNIIFKRSHGKYGILSPKGALNTMENMSVYSAEAYYDNYERATVTCSVYHNPSLAFDLDILYGSYDGYEQLAYIESNGNIRNKLTFKGSEIKNGYNLYRESNNVDVYHQYRFNPTITRDDGSPWSGVAISISDVNGVVVYNGVSDMLGVIDTWITYYEDIVATGTSIKTPHTITLTAGDKTSVNELYINKNYENFPYYFTSTTTTSTGGGCTGLEATIMAKLDDISNAQIATDNKIDNMSTATITEINENERIIKETSSFSIII